MDKDVRDSLESQTRVSLAWSAIERFSVQIVQLGVTVILARLLAPREYGVVAALNVFISLAQIVVESGFTSALIQKGDADETDFATAFHVNVVLAIALYLILFLGAPYIAVFFSIPEMTMLCRWLGLMLVVQALTLVHTAKLTIAIDFKSQARVSLLAAGIGGAIGIALAYRGEGAWALVGQALGASVVSTLLLWHIVPWRPSAVFSVKSFRGLYGFGSRLLAASLLHTAYLNLYNVAIGRRYSAEQLGYYSQSSYIARFASINLMAIITRATYPILCSHKDDIPLVRDSFLKVLRMSSFLIFPIICGLAALSTPLVTLLLTETWAPMSRYLALLCLAHLLIPVSVLNNQLLAVRGQMDLFLKAEVLKKCAGVALLLATLPFGLGWVMVGILLCNIFDLVVIIGCSRRSIGVGYRAQAKEIAVFLLMAGAAGIAAYAVSHSVSGVRAQIVLGAGAGIVVYFAFAEVLGVVEYRAIKQRLFVVAGI